MPNNNEQNPDAVRAWKDEEYRLNLSEEERAKLPDDPAGAIELLDNDLEHLAGGLMAPCTCKEYSC